LQQTLYRKDDVMMRFIQRHAEQIIGTLRGWDRLRFRGTVRMLANVTGLDRFLGYTGRGLRKEFGKHALELSRQVRQQSQQAFETSQRPVIHVDSPSVCKEDLAREIARRDAVKQGPICLITAVEGCWSFDIKSNRATGHLDLAPTYRKCLHLYHYQIHRQLGFMHTRLQTWLPFNVWVNLNGREWLGRQLDAVGMGYRRHENCFTQVDDMAAAQALLDEQVSVDWTKLLKPLGETANPALRPIMGRYEMDYYWSLDQSEYATDVLFRTPGALARLYPSLLRQGIETFSSPDVMRFLGRRVDKGITPRFSGEVISDLRSRPEGVRIKHRVNDNSVKMYDKAGSVLRVETTLNNVRDLKSPRQRKGKQVWMPMRKGVADAPRRAAVSAASNDRYLNALSAAQTPTPLKTLTEGLSRPVRWKKQSVRGLNLLGADDATLLAAIGRGEFVVNGLRNRDLQQLIFPAACKAGQQKRRSGQVTRKLRMLRAHGLIQKVPHTHRYTVTDKGRQIIAAIAAAREANIEKLAKAA
jgi:hypothetical protein